MARTVGFILGGLFLLDGLNTALQPRFGFRFWQERLRGRLPESMDRMATEYSQLSDSAIRYLASYEVAMAGLLLWLASRARD